ncbi:MAG TPA: 6-carboxytetrahydropterin synthase [Thermoanaerobaculia bacterium]|nr:6-carboxytetrahydropterin synthase [Thermoanaerobaculia bacterium]
MAGPRFSIQLAKEDFKFSAAHFTVFGGDRAELLHGHNYRVSVELGGASLDADGFLVDLDQVKTLVRAACADLDERTLVPGRSPHVAIDEAEGRVTVGFAERRYELPSADVLVLPIRNVTIEALAAHLWRELRAGLQAERVDRLAVIVEETAGQRCAYEAGLDAPD